MNETTVMPWLIGLLSLLLVASTIITVKAWRDAKRSPFFFLRRQAQKRMQSGAMASVVLVVLTLGVGTYMQQQQQQPATARFALITDMKPTAATQAAVDDGEAETAVAFTADSARTTGLQSDSEPAVDSIALAPITAVPVELPPEFDQFEAQAELEADTVLGAIAFAADMDDEFRAIAPQRIYEEGSYTIYATFSYEQMKDGMVWSWVWRYNGDVISGGNEVWRYGSDGPGYIFLKPEGGFVPGEYNLQVWVNDELLTTSELFVTGTTAANQ